MYTVIILQHQVFRATARTLLNSYHLYDCPFPSPRYQTQNQKKYKIINNYQIHHTRTDNFANIFLNKFTENQKYAYCFQCENNGCVEDTTLECINQLNADVICKCKPKFTGKQCENRAEIHAAHSYTSNIPKIIENTKTKQADIIPVYDGESLFNAEDSEFYGAVPYSCHKCNPYFRKSCEEFQPTARRPTKKTRLRRRRKQKNSPPKKYSICRCHPGYSGKFCNIDFCDKCDRQGTITLDPSQYKDKFEIKYPTRNLSPFMNNYFDCDRENEKCHCKPRYSGKYCNVSEKCAQCHSEGTKWDVERGTFQCKLPKYLEEQHQKYNISRDYWELRQREHQICDCLPNWAGDLCDQRVGLGCSRKGTKVCDASTNFRCRCKKNFRGKNCQDRTSKTSTITSTKCHDDDRKYCKIWTRDYGFNFRKFNEYFLAERETRPVKKRKHVAKIKENFRLF